MYSHWEINDRLGSWPREARVTRPTSTVGLRYLCSVVGTIQWLHNAMTVNYLLLSASAARDVIYDVMPVMLHTLRHQSSETNPLQILVIRRPSMVLTMSIDTLQWRHENVTIYNEYLTHSEKNFTQLWSALTDCHLLHFLLRLMQVWQRNDEKSKWLFLWASSIVTTKIGYWRYRRLVIKRWQLW